MQEVFELTPAAVRSFWFLGAIALLLIGLTVLLGYFAFSARRSTLEITAGALRVNAGIYSRSIPLDQLAVEQAQRLDLDAEHPLRPTLRTNGIGLPGYQAGWFKLRNGQKALLHVTDRTRVVYVPTHAGYVLLLSVQEPDAFLQALAAAKAG